MPYYPELHKDLFKLLTELQIKFSRKEKSTPEELTEIKNKILRWQAPAPRWEVDVHYWMDFFQKRGLQFKEQWNTLNAILEKNKFDPQLSLALDDPSLLEEVGKRLHERLRESILIEAESLLYRGNIDALASYVAKALSAYPIFQDDIQRILDKAACSATAPEPASPPTEPINIPRVDHRISTRQPRAKWTLWLDETGENFDLRHTEDGQDGLMGRFVALLVPPSGVSLPPLGREFHASRLSNRDILELVSKVLSSDCGIFGLSADCLRASSREGWYSLLLETILWVLRLIPRPSGGSPVEIDIFVEQRDSFTPTKDRNEALLLSVRQLLGQEKCASGLLLGKVEFCPKNDGFLGWVDLLANFWGGSGPGREKALEASGLPGSCLFSACGPLAEAARKALQGERLNAEQWHMLCSAEDALIEGSLPFLALQTLHETCAAEKGESYSAAWHPYIMHCAGILEKRYSPSAVEAQIRWLRHADKKKLKLPDLFFLSMNELAFCNHIGDISSPELRAAVSVVETYASAVAGVHPLVNAQAILRLAVAYANAFDFEKASELLQPWILGEKSRTLNAELTGKFLSSLGQYEAFCQRYKSADDCFQLALAHFKSLLAVDENVASKQLGQTSIYAATNAMDWAEKTQEEVVEMVEQALGCSLEEAIRTDAISEDRYRTALLFRYLTARGTQAEKAAMLSRSGSWILTGRGQKLWPWPLIWYHRARLAGEAGNSELRKSMAEQLEHCKEVNDITIQLIIAVLETALGEADPADPETAAVLAKARELMPAVKDRIDKVTADHKGDAALVQDVLSFNYR